MKPKIHFVLLLCLAAGIAAQKVDVAQLPGEQAKSIRQAPEVYDIRVWSDPVLPLGSDTTFGLDTSEVKNYCKDAPQATRFLIRAIEFYDAQKHKEAIESCRKALSVNSSKNGMVNYFTHYLTGTSYLHLSEIEKATPQFQVALKFLPTDDESYLTLKARLFNNLAHCYSGERDIIPIAIKYLKRSIKYFNLAGIQNYLPYYNQAIHWGGEIKQDTARYYLRIAEKMMRSIIDQQKNSQVELRLNLKLAFAYWIHGDSETALRYYQELIDNIVGLPGQDSSDLIQAYTNYAWMAYYPNSPDLALRFSEMALDLSIKHLGPEHLYTGTIYNLVALCHMVSGNYDEAIFHFEKRLDINYPEELDYVIVTRVYNNIALCHLKKGNHDIAINYILKAIEYSNDFLADQEDWVAGWYINLGYAYAEQHNFDQALASYDFALNRFSSSGGSCNTQVAGIYCEIGICYEKNHDKERAIKNYNNALTSLQCESTHSEFWNSEFMYNWTHLFVLSGKARMYHEYWMQRQLQSYLDSALVSYHTAILLIDSMQQNYRLSGSRFRVSHIMSEVQAIYEGAISCHLDNYRNNGQAGSLEEAFSLAEKSKAILLLESVRASGQDHIVNVPNTLLQQRNGLKQNIADLKTDIWREEQKGPEGKKKKIKALKVSLFDRWQAYEKLTRKIRKEYPASIDGIDMQVIDLRDIQQNLLNPGQALLAYFEGFSSIFAFVISRDSVFAKEIPVDFPLEKYVQDLRSGIYDAFVRRHLQGSQNVHERKTGYKESAHALYIELIKPLGNLPEELIIVPDGILGYIPFEVLMVNKPEASEIDEQDYLINHHLVSYNYSATMWNEMTQRKIEKEGLLAFAPTFAVNNTEYISISDYRGDDLGPLLYNDDEVEYIRSLTKGMALYGNMATAYNFKNLAADYSILHLSTHAKLNDENADYSFLAFTGEIDEEAGRLYISDLSQMGLSAEMVVLSACETGIGKLQRGEGIMSFARAFSSAGAKSIVTSLWKANDKTTFEIMRSFYDHLREGETKAEALRAAKLDYLATHKGEELHPFYWATFIPVGDMAPVRTGAGASVLKWLLIPLVMLAAGIGWFVIMHKLKKTGPVSLPRVGREKSFDSKSAMS